MTSENITKERWDQLGLPPIELAESSADNRNNNGLYKCLLPTLQKIIVVLLLTIFGVGTYVLLLKISENYDNTRNTEIIIVTGSHESPNVTVHNMEIFLQLKNSSSGLKTKRKKRHTIPKADSTIQLEDPFMNDEQLQKAREIILDHDEKCKNEEKQEICKNFVNKLKALAEIKDEPKTNEEPLRIGLKVNVDKGNKTKKNDVVPTDVSKRETSPIMNLDKILESLPTIPLETRDTGPFTNPNLIPYQHSISGPHLTDTCLLARLLKHNYPSAKGIYDPSSEYLAPHYEHPLHPQSRFFTPSLQAPYLQARDMDMHGKKIHPQDIDIFMSLLTSKSEPTATEHPTNKTRETECPFGTISCLSGDACVEEKQWCNGNVDCADVSDEARCNCKARVDESRLCDGYFDCPFGEDEMGCYGCSDNMFSCEDLNINSQSTCFTKEQRCNNVVDCPNHKDEVECNMLAPSLLKKPSYAISNTEGFLHRNFKGDWYAVCRNPYMWAHDACRRETGLIIRPPFIQIVPIDPMLKIDYLNTGPSGLIQTSDTCMNSSAVYVTCPDLLCGTRVQSTSQLLRENAAIENHLFGRNKRFLLANRQFPLMFYGNRLKRDIVDRNYGSKVDTKRDLINAMRKKRTESRVVGGKPSQPAAWPWMVAIYRNGVFHCGGVVVTHSWVVSAAHCVHKFWDHYFEVQVGMLRRFSFSPQEHSHRITHVIVNQHYSQTDMKNDLSLLRVEPAIQFSRWVRPICLPSPDTAGPDWLWGPSPGTICTAVGWGATIEHGPDPDHMREVEVPIWENCKHEEDRAGKEICAGFVEGGKDACQGDSGGPLLCRNPLNSQQWYMAGIVSHGDGCARKDEPGVYTRVSLFVKWIKYHISSTSLPIVQPVQECPGFKCKSVISKCLPNKRKCDRIVDCLDGEDETKCEFTRSVTSLPDDIFVHPKTTFEELFEAKETQTESTLTSNSAENKEGTTPPKNPLEKDSSTIVNATEKNKETQKDLALTSGSDKNQERTTVTKNSLDDDRSTTRTNTENNKEIQTESGLTSSSDKNEEGIPVTKNPLNDDRSTTQTNIENNKEIKADSELTSDNDKHQEGTTVIKNLLDDGKSNKETQPELPLTAGNNINHKGRTVTNSLDDERSKTPTDVENKNKTQTKLSLTSGSGKNQEGTTKNPLDDDRSTTRTNTEKVNETITDLTLNSSNNVSQDDTSSSKNLHHDSSTAQTGTEKVYSSTDSFNETNVQDSEVFVVNTPFDENFKQKLKSKESTDLKQPDFEHASTLEIINESSSENFGFSRETGTADPISLTSTENPTQNRGDTEILTVDISGESLESRSSILEKNKEATTQTSLQNINSGSVENGTNVENDPNNESLFGNNLGTTTAIFMQNNIIDPIPKVETTTALTQIENLLKNNLNNKIDNTSETVIRLLPVSGISDQDTAETKFTDDKNNVTLSNKEDTPSEKALPDSGISNQETAETKLTDDKNVTINRKQDSPSKKVLDFEDKTDDMINELEEIELEPAKFRRKHRVPAEFECRRIDQTIPYNQRCDRKADCEDGTDELDCTCNDFLSTFEPKLICDGVIDCADGQDESDCFSCPEDYFLCKRSQVCLPEKHVCDGNPECPQDEDELDCFALSNGKEMEFGLDDRPIVNLEGYLTKKHMKDWHVVCDDKLSLEQQEQAATRICRYLGFSSANRYNVKYINLKEDEIAERSLDNKRNRRNTMERVPIHFTYRQESEDNDTARQIVIKEPQVLKEQCVPNITKTCKSLYVFCDNSLFTDFDDTQNIFLRDTESVSNHTWPWIAKVFIEGDYRCTGVLVNLSWILVSESCLWDTTLSHHYITVVLGSHRTLGSINGMHEQVYQVDAKKDIYHSKASLLHLREPAHYSNIVKPMVVSSSSSFEQKSTCVAVGQDDRNHTISVFLEETGENCHPSNRCFKRKAKGKICDLDASSHRHWAGIVSCHTDQGWYPAATFVDDRGECGLGDHINATDIENLKNEIKHHYGKKTLPSLIDKDYVDACRGVRCGRGRCVSMHQVCDGVRDCEDGNDESENSCGMKHEMCDKDPYEKGCECSVGQMKCRNGKCVSKELFRDGNNDCGDFTDEPRQTTCSDYLARVTPSRLCDGILHCHDRSDEDPMFCKCFAKRNYKCGSKSSIEHCVAPDMVCDGIRDCPNGEDEQTCIGLNAAQGTPYGTGQVIVRSHGVWHSKCYASQNHTKSELEAICAELGFRNGHAKQINEMEKFVVHPFNNLMIEPFNKIILNNNTILKMRNTHEPIAKAVFDEELQNCHPVFIECR